MTDPQSPSDIDIQAAALPEAESALSSPIYEFLQQAQMALDSMVEMLNKIDQNSDGIVDGIGKFRESALDRKKALEEEKERMEKVAYTLLDLLNK